MKTNLLRYAFTFALLAVTFSCSDDDTQPLPDLGGVEDPGGDEKPDVTGDETSVADEIFKLVNAHRQSIGLAAMDKSTTADQLAVEHSKYMITQGRISHDNQETKFTALREKENATGFAENVAAGQPTAQSVMTAWLNSSGHKANIEGNYTHIGIGVAKDQNGSNYYTQIFYR